MVSATDGSAFTSAVTVSVTGDAGTQATGSVGAGACTHEGLGFHTYAPAQAETNYDHVAFTFTGTGAIPATVQVYTTFPQTGDNFARLGAPAGASVSADVAAVKADTAAVKTKTDFLPSATAGAAGGVFIAGSNAATSITTALTANVIGNVTGNLSGSVGSVTGLTASDVGAIKAKTDSLTFTVAGMVDANVVDWKGATAPAMTGDAFARLGAPAGASVSADIADLPTNAELATALGTADDAVLAQVALVKAKTDNLPSDPADASDIATAFSALDVKVDAIGAVTDKLDDTVELTSDGWIFTTEALQNVAAASGPTAADIADAVWEEDLSDHSGTAGSTAEALDAAGSAGDPWVTALPGGYSAGQAGYIVGTNVNATISSRSTQTSVDDIPTNAELATALGTADDAVLAQVALVKAKTDNLPSDPADASDIAGALTTIGGYIDTETGSILTAVNAIKEYADNTVVRGTVSGTSPTTTTFTTSALSPAGVDADQFKGRIIVWDNDTTTTALRGQATDITASSAASNPLLTFTALTTAPQSGDTFSIV